MSCRPRFCIGLAMSGLMIALHGCSKPDQSSSTSEVPMVPSSMIIAAQDPRIAVIGRAATLEDGGLQFGYPGVTLKFNIESRGALLHIASSGDQSYLDIIVDNGKPQAIKLSAGLQSIPLFNDEVPTAHQINIIHRSETWHGLVTIKSLEVLDGEIKAPASLPDRRLLVLGDSVTCGEAIERTPECAKDSSWWNPRLSYGMLVAGALDAQVHLVCFGGRGLIRSWNGKTDELNLPDFFELAIADPQTPIAWDHSRYTPDLILSAIGTNDFSQGIPDREAYISAYVKLAHRLLDLYPQAKIALTEGAILSGEKKAALSEYLAATAQHVNNPRLSVIPSEHYPGDACDAHPTREQHASMAENLTPHLQRIVHW